MTKSRPLCTQEKLVRLYGISNPTHLWKFNFAKISNLTTLFTDTHWEKAHSNKTPGITRNKNLDICVVGTSNQLFIRGS